MTVFRESDPAELNQAKRRLRYIDGAKGYSESWGEPMVVLDSKIHVDTIDRIREETPLTPKELKIEGPEGYRLNLTVDMGEPFGCEDCDHVARDYREGVGWLCEFCEEVHRWFDRTDDVDREFIVREYMHNDEWDREIPEPGDE